MAIEILTLGAGCLNSADAIGVFAIDASEPAKTIVVASMRFGNASNGTRKLNAWFQKSGEADDHRRRILPVDLEIPAGGSYVDNDEITLAYADSIVIQQDNFQAAGITYQVSGFMRDPNNYF